MRVVLQIEKQEWEINSKTGGLAVKMKLDKAAAATTAIPTTTIHARTADAAYDLISLLIPTEDKVKSKVTFFINMTEIKQFEFMWKNDMLETLQKLINVLANTTLALHVGDIIAATTATTKSTKTKRGTSDFLGEIDTQLKRARID